MPIKNIRWTCSECESIIDTDIAIAVLAEDEELQENIKKYQNDYKLFKNNENQVIRHKHHLQNLVALHNAKFGLKKWHFYMLNSYMKIIVNDHNKWYEFGKSGKTIKKVDIQFPKPNKDFYLMEFMTCPVCMRKNYLPSKYIDLSEE